MPFIAIALALMLALGGGISVAAEHAEPGDALFGIKTHVKNNIEAAVSNLETRLGINTDAEATDESNASEEGVEHPSATSSAEVETHAQATVKVNASIEGSNDDGMEDGVMGTAQLH